MWPTKLNLIVGLNNARLYMCLLSFEDADGHVLIDVVGICPFVVTNESFNSQG
jgi:hypothetical protein